MRHKRVYRPKVTPLNLDQIHREQAQRIMVAASEAGIEAAEVEHRDGPTPPLGQGGWWLQDSDGWRYLGWGVDEVVAQLKGTPPAKETQRVERPKEEGPCRRRPRWIAQQR